MFNCATWPWPSDLEQRPQLANRITSTLRQDTCERLIGSAKTSAGIAGEVYRILMAGSVLPQ